MRVCEILTLGFMLLASTTETLCCLSGLELQQNRRVVATSKMELKSFMGWRITIRFEPNAESRKIVY